MIIDRRSFVSGSVAGLLSLKSKMAFAQAADDHPLRIPSYSPPTRGGPANRIGAASRSLSAQVPSVWLLAPDHVGSANTDQPVVYWYLSLAAAGKDIKIVLSNESGSEVLRTHDLANTVIRGMHSLSLADEGIHLRPETTYQIKMSYAPDGDVSRARTSQAFILYSEAPPALKRKITNAKADDLPFIYASAGYWYAALQSLGTLIAANPTNAGYKQMRAALLDQVKLHEAADFDRETA
jgi:hypothetical protein